MTAVENRPSTDSFDSLNPATARWSHVPIDDQPR